MKQLSKVDGDKVTSQFVSEQEIHLIVSERPMPVQCMQFISFTRSFSKLEFKFAYR